MWWFYCLEKISITRKQKIIFLKIYPSCDGVRIIFPIFFFFIETKYRSLFLTLIHLSYLPTYIFLGFIFNDRKEKMCDSSIPDSFIVATYLMFYWGLKYYLDFITYILKFRSNLNPLLYSDDFTLQCVPKLSHIFDHEVLFFWKSLVRFINFLDYTSNWLNL